jgi:hypothetical protein
MEAPNSLYGKELPSPIQSLGSFKQVLPTNHFLKEPWPKTGAIRSPNVIRTHFEPGFSILFSPQEG